MPSGDEVAISIAGVLTRRALLPSRLHLLDPKDRTGLLELCLARAVEWFMREYMPLRFNAGYARAELGYVIKGKTRRIKAEAAKQYPDAILPNVRSGETRRDVLSHTSIETKAVGGAKSGQVVAKIKLHLPGYITQAYSLTGNILSKITATEAERIAKRFFEEIVSASERIQDMPDLRDSKFTNRVDPYDASQIGRTNRATIIAQRNSMAQEARNG